MRKFQEFIKANKFTIIFIALGFTLAILFLTIGFLRTLLFLVLVGTGSIIGYLLDAKGAEGVKEFFIDLFSSKKH